MPHAAPNRLEFAIVALSDAELNPAWSWATILYRDDMGDVVGYGRLTRLNDGAAEVATNFSASAVNLLSGSPLLGDE